jgi:hypothetical protein
MSWKIAPLGETRQLFMGETPKTAFSAAIRPYKWWFNGKFA